MCSSIRQPSEFKVASLTNPGAMPRGFGVWWSCTAFGGGRLRSMQFECPVRGGHWFWRLGGVTARSFPWAAKKQALCSRADNHGFLPYRIAEATRTRETTSHCDEFTRFAPPSICPLRKRCRTTAQDLAALSPDLSASGDFCCTTRHKFGRSPVARRRRPRSPEGCRNVAGGNTPGMHTTSDCTPAGVLEPDALRKSRTRRSPQIRLTP